MKKRCRNWVQYNSFNVNTVSAASQISRSGPHVLIISSSQGEASPAAFVGLIRLENTTVVESDRMCLWAWERKGWEHPFPTLGYLTLGKSSSLFLRQPHGEAQRARGWSLLTATTCGASQQGFTTGLRWWVSQQSALLDHVNLSSIRQNAHSKKKNPTWWHILVILGPGRQDHTQWVPGAHWPGSFGEF